MDDDVKVPGGDDFGDEAALPTDIPGEVGEEESEDGPGLESEDE